MDRKFKLKFKEIAFENNGALIKDLCNIIDLPEGHYSHSVLNRYYRKYPNVFLDKELAKKVLTSHLKNGCLFIVDYDKPFQGGYAKQLLPVINDDELQIDLKINEAINTNWKKFVESLKYAFWEEKENTSKYIALGSNEFFENRLPINKKESFLSSERDIVIDGEVKNIKYNYFNIKNVLEYYIALIKEFYPDFKLINTISNNKFKRFAKEIDNGFYLGLYVDFSFLEAELKNTYLELPKIKIEFFSNVLSKPIKEEKYLKEQDEFPIVRINYSYFIGNPIDSRIGNSSESQDHLRKNLFYYFNVYSYYLSVYIKAIETNLIQTLHTSNL